MLESQQDTSFFRFQMPSSEQLIDELDWTGDSAAVGGVCCRLCFIRKGYFL